jgi:multiple antibiotic resistance protein
VNFFSSVLTLFLVQDPIGNIPICLALLRAIPKQRHAWVIIRENLIAFLISSIFLLSGNTLLNHLQITTPALGIAGGCILFVVAFSMVFPDFTKQKHDGPSSQEPFIVPLAIPLLAGPSTMATLTLYSSQYPADMGLLLLALLVVTLLSTAILLLALNLYQWLKPQLLQALERLMGVILITMATQIILDNLYAYFKLATTQ